MRVGCHGIPSRDHADPIIKDSLNRLVHGVIDATTPNGARSISKSIVSGICNWLKYLRTCFMNHEKIFLDLILYSSKPPVSSCAISARYVHQLVALLRMLTSLFFSEASLQEFDALFGFAETASSTVQRHRVAVRWGLVFACTLLELSSTS